MSQKEVQKKREVQIEEDKDFYLSFLNKKLRNSRKKLEQIEELAKKDAKTLKPEQVEKINARTDVLQTIQHFEGLKDLYYQAYKVGIEEGKVTPKESSTETNRKSVQVHETANAAEVGKQGDVSRDEIIKETVQKVLNLLTFSQVLQSQIGKEELSKEETTGLDGLQQFCQNLNLSPLERSLNISERKSDTLEKIVSYVRSEETPAIGETSYKQVQEAIERIVETSTFTKLDLTPKDIPTSQIQTTQIQTPIVKAVEEERVQVQEEELSTGAAVLKPDTSDSNASPGSAQYHPKVVRFVDEIEKDMLAQSPKKENVDAVTEPAKGILKESTKEAANEEEREGGEGSQEQKSFRKKRNNEQGGGKYYNGERKTQSNRGGQGQGQYSYNSKKGGYKENKYSRGGRDEEYYQPRGGYQVKEYVEKKPQAA